MRFEKTLPLRDGRTLRIRNAEPADAQALLELIILTHSQTDYLLAYPDERRFTPEQEAEYLKGMLESDREIMLLAEIDGTLCGCLGLNAIGGRYKVRHRAEFGISVDEAVWGLGFDGSSYCMRKAVPLHPVGAQRRSGQRTGRVHVS